MDKLVDFAEMITQMSVISLIAYVVGYLLTETSMRIPLHFKPFNCRPCFSFWLSFLGSSSFLFFTKTQCLKSNLELFLAYICIAFLLSLIIFFIVKSKLKIHE